ncbi:hypothetical protein [Microbacterium sp.]|uniref:hypothetical protein n=1 Tax=Microbacterium sp. TaxID=51671 RepID=UPI0039E6912A
MRMPRSRIGRAAVGAALAAVLLSGCTPTPEPTPTPTGFATDEEAFEAAEATYRSYLSAFDAMDLADPDSFEPVFAWTTGAALAKDRKTLTTMHANGWLMTGAGQIVSMHEGARSSERVTAVACIDVSDVQIVDAEGASQVEPDRAERFGLALSFTYSSDSPTGLLIEKSESAEDQPCE